MSLQPLSGVFRPKGFCASATATARISTADILSGRRTGPHGLMFLVPKRPSRSVGVSTAPEGAGEHCQGRLVLKRARRVCPACHRKGTLYWCDRGLVIKRNTTNNTRLHLLAVWSVLQLSSQLRVTSVLFPIFYFQWWQPPDVWHHPSPFPNIDMAER